MLRNLLTLMLLASASHVLAVTTYIHTDYLGSTAAESNAAGQITKRYHFEPYGESIGAGADNEPGYTGHVRDQDLGLVYMQQRYYDPAVGRFISNDPISFTTSNPQTFNRYAYANNNPYKYVDPNGEAIMFAPLIGFIVKEALAEVASEATGGATDFLSFRRSTQNLGMAAARKLGTPTAEVARDPVRAAMARGRESEIRVLNDLGLPRNTTQKVRTAEGNSIPDSLTRSESVEIKDTASVYATRQIRIQTGAARAANRVSTLVTGERTHVAKTAERLFDRIVRRSDLGPQ